MPARVPPLSLSGLKDHAPDVDVSTSHESGTTARSPALASSAGPLQALRSMEGRATHAPAASGELPRSLFRVKAPPASAAVAVTVSRSSHAVRPLAQRHGALGQTADDVRALTASLAHRPVSACAVAGAASTIAAVVAATVGASLKLHLSHNAVRVQPVQAITRPAAPSSGKL